MKTKIVSCYASFRKALRKNKKEFALLQFVGRLEDYLADAKDGAAVYLGLKEAIDRDKMIRDLEVAQVAGDLFDAEKYVQAWPAKKQDHFLIPAGTVHCSRKDCMVLEISATPEYPHF